MNNKTTNNYSIGLTEVVADYKKNRTLLNRLFQKQLDGTITFEDMILQYKVYKRVRKLERILHSWIKTDREAA